MKPFKTVEERLDDLAELEARKDAIRLQFEEIIAGFEAEIPPEILAKIKLAELNRDEMIEDLGKQIEDLITTIESEIKNLGETKTGNFLQAVYTPGRVTWNTKGLEGAAVLLPDLLQYRKVGEPFVVIRKVGQKSDRKPGTR